jgi:tensin
VSCGDALIIRFRYVEYFAGLLSGAIQVNSSPLFLDHVTVVGIPAFQSNGGCRAFFKVKKNKQPNPIVIFPFSPFYDFSFSFLFILPKVYQGSVPVHTSSIYNLHDSARHFTMSLGERGLALRGDILVKCYHRHRLPVDGRETIFSLQFHTCAVTQHTLVFQRQDLDDACQGPYQNKVVFLSFLLSLSLSRLLLPLFAFLFGPIVIEAHRRHGRQQTRIRMR